MLNTPGIAATLTHAATTHLLPGTVLLAGAFLIFKVSTRKSEQKNQQQRAESEQKQAELEQKLADLQGQYDSFRQTQDEGGPVAPKSARSGPVKAASNAVPISGKQRFFETIINENIALREAANA